MQITANQPSLPLTTQVIQANQASRENIEKEVGVPDLSVTYLAETISPATQVNISGPRNAADLYEQPKLVEIIQMNYTQDKGEAATKVSQTLAADASSLRKNKSPFSPSSFLSQIGSLSRETSSYKNAAFSYQLPSTKADKLKLNFSDTGGAPQATVTLRVRTKDGDNIDIKIQHSRSALGDNLEFSFDVDGKLSETEQDALEKLANKLGQVADDFFRTGTTQLHGLEEFDKTSLQDFHIDFSKMKSIGKYDTMSYDFSVDEATQTQHLRAKDSNGYSLDITVNLQDLLNTAGGSFNNSLENYLTIIRQSLNEHQALQEENSNMPSLSFIIDGFTSMLSPGANREAAPATSQIDKAVNAFDTGLPDFNAVIKAPLYIYRDPIHHLVIPETMSLALAQRTETKSFADGSKLVKQVNSFERQSSQIEGIVGSVKGDLTTGNFNFKKVYEKQETSRILSVDKDEINNLITEHSSEKETSVESYRNFSLKDVQEDQRNDYKVSQLVDEIKKHQGLKQAFDKLNYVALSNDKLFF